MVTRLPSGDVRGDFGISAQVSEVFPFSIKGLFGPDADFYLSGGARVPDLNHHTAKPVLRWKAVNASR